MIRKAQFSPRAWNFLRFTMDIHGKMRKKYENCLRFATPAEATGGLEALTFGGLEALKGIEAWNVDITIKGCQT